MFRRTFIRFTFIILLAAAGLLVLAATKSNLAEEKSSCSTISGCDGPVSQPEFILLGSISQAILVSKR